MYRAVFTCDQRYQGLRLDAAIALSDASISKRKAKAIVDLGGVYVNGRRTRIASTLIQHGDRIEVNFNPALLESKAREEMVLGKDAILYLDDRLVAINKPPGLASQATRDQSVIHAVPLVEKLLKSLGERPGKLILLHRLDKETSGILLIARHDRVATQLTDAFRHRTVKKTYHAICYGTPSQPNFTEECFLSDINKKTGIVTVVHAGGRPSKTHFHLLESFDSPQLCLMQAEPHTGRSHQIRVHLEKNGLPIVGDKKYGVGARQALPTPLAAIASRHHFLHAQAIAFTLDPAQNKALQLEAPYPPSFVEFLTALRLNKSSD